MNTKQRTFVIALFASAIPGSAFAQSSLVCPAVQSTGTQSGGTLQSDCAGSSASSCTSKTGVTWDTTNNVLTLPGSAGNFQGPPNSAVNARVFFAAAGDFDNDGWTDFVAADEFDKMWVMRNQTITCGTGGCSSASPPIVQNISPATWWDTLSNKRDAAFRQPTSITTSYNTITQFTCNGNTINFGSGSTSQCSSGNSMVSYSNGTKTVTCTRNPGSGSTITCNGAGGQSMSCNSRTVSCPAATTTTTTASINLKEPAAASGQRYTPMASGDFDGDGWTDFIAISNMYIPSATYPVHATAARMFMNTKNCRLTSEVTNPKPCGIGSLCTGQPANGACSGGSVTNGTAYGQANLSCLTTSSCPYYMPTFASYDLLTGAAISVTGDTDATADSGTATAAPYNEPGDFGNIDHPVGNVVVLDFDGDGDLDLLFGHGPGAPPSSLASTNSAASGATSFVGIDVWLNSCAASAQWNSTAKSCVGHIPVFRHTTPPTTCTGPGCIKCDGNSCNGSDILIPSTAHNNSTLEPDDNLFFDYANHKTPGFAYSDIDKDGDYDLVLGSPGCCNTSGNQKYRLRVFKGTSGSPTVHTLDTANPIFLGTSDGTYSGFTGALTGVFVHDFSGDGYADIITGQDGFSYSSTLGGRTRYWKHTGNATNPYGTNWPSCSSNPGSCIGCSSSCNPESTTSISNNCGSNSCASTLSPATFPDFDMGFMLDYDNDPNHTLDMVFTNGNTADQFYIFPNRASNSTVAACGTVSSGTLGSPADESTVSGACITPTAAFPNGTSSIKYYLTNEDPANYSLACTQTNAGFTPTTCCVTFANITGKTIRWKAEMDSNTTDGDGVCTATSTQSPTISSVAANYTYSLAAQHYRAGVVVTDGAVYAGSFFQPGNRGAFYALKAGGTSMDLPYYNSATKIDAQADGTLSSYPRNLYTASGTGTGISTMNLSSATDAQMGASSPTTAAMVVNWLKTKRFGLGTTTTRLGAVMDSTPAILSPPYLPDYYIYLPSTDKAMFDTFSTTNANRLPLAIFSAMDGAIHAIRSQATTLNDVSKVYNGTEAWAFVPPYVAQYMGADYVSTQSTGSLVVRSYPDGSPTLLDYRKADGSTIRTVALVPDAAGGSSITALDVTSTVTPTVTNYTTVTGPTAMWSQRPGDSLAGKAWAKPGVARTKISGNEKYVVVAGTGIDSADTSKGKIVSGYNLETGALLWKFEASCAVTSDITIAETDDTGETGAPTVDGFADRAFFADNCGYVYKINPGQDLSGGWMANTGYGSITLGVSNGAARFALFSTMQATAFGGSEQRPIAGAIGAKIDSSGDLVLYFGTGGLETYDASKQNKFFAVRAKDGTVRSSVTASCTGSGASAKCDKFYGGVVVADTNVIVQRTRDAVISGTVGGTCDLGTTAIEFLDSNTFSLTTSLTSIAGQPISATSGPLYGDAGALYFATVDGSINRVGTPRATTAGADTASGNMNHMAGSGTSSYDTPFTMVGWRVVL